MWFRFGKKAIKRSDEIHWGRSLSVTFLMVGAILVASICVFNYINNMERDRCFERLYEEARNIASYIERGVNNDREQLELLAAIIANHKGLSTSELQHLLSSFDQVGMMAHVNLLLPDNTMITHDGTLRWSRRFVHN